MDISVTNKFKGHLPVIFLFTGIMVVIGILAFMKSANSTGQSVFLSLSGKGKTPTIITVEEMNAQQAVENAVTAFLTLDYPAGFQAYTDHLCSAAIADSCPTLQVLAQVIWLKAEQSQSGSRVEILASEKLSDGSLKGGAITQTWKVTVRQYNLWTTETETAVTTVVVKTNAGWKLYGFGFDPAGSGE